METGIYVKFFNRAFEKCVMDSLKRKNNNITYEELKEIKGISISTTDSAAFSIPWQADASAFNMCIPNLIFNVNKSENSLWIKDLLLFKHIKSLHIYAETEDLSFFQELKNLKELYIVNTKDTDWNFIKNLTKLEYLCVQNSEFKDLNVISKLCEEQKCIEKSYKSNPSNNNYMFYPRLEHLHLVNCGIENLEPLRNCDSLMDLNLSMNNITNIEPLKDIRCLYYLTLRYNKIENIESFGAMKGLYYLNLRHNKIKDISIFNNKEDYSLSKLFLEDNLIQDYLPIKGWRVPKDVRYEDKILEEKEPYLFLDFDFTCTYMNGVKEGLSEFLEFCLENFNVYWCSYADYFHILEELEEDNISKDLFDKIIYKEVEGKSKIEFIYNIIGDSKNFVYIDDDISELDYSMLENANLLNNFIKAVNNKHDLKRIREELEKKL